MSIRILIVDDEDDIREILKESFLDEKFQVVEACDGKDALEKFEQNKIDIILSDIKMPNMNGIEFSKVIKERSPNTPIFLITAFSEYTEKEVLSIGVEAIIFKPFDIFEIIEIIKNKLKVDQSCEA